MYVEEAGKTRRESLLEQCLRQAAVVYNGIPVAGDYRVRFILEDRELGAIRSAPRMLAEAATGLALAQGLASCGDVVVEEGVEESNGGGLGLVFYGRLVERRRRCPVYSGRIPVEQLVAVYRDFAERLPKKNCPIAVHRLAVYAVEPGRGHRFLFFIADPSRHAAAYKLAGLFSSHAGELCSGGEEPVVVSTGRISDDMVRALASAGLRVIVSLHHPLLSGLAEAEKLGITLVLREPGSPRLRAYTAPWRITG